MVVDTLIYLFETLSQCNVEAKATYHLSVFVMRQRLTITDTAAAGEIITHPKPYPAPVAAGR